MSYPFKSVFLIGHKLCGIVFLCPISNQYISRSFRDALYGQENFKSAGGHIFNLSHFTEYPMRKVLGERGPEKQESCKFKLLLRPNQAFLFSLTFWNL